MCVRACVLALGWLAAGSPAAVAQTDLPPPLPDTTASRYGTSTAVVFEMTEYGLGIGASGRTRLTNDLSAVVEIGVGAGRDEREQRFGLDAGLFGESEISLKRNYVLMAPLHAGLELRMFRRRVEDNFRPFVHAAVGPTLALQWPYFEDLDGDGQRDDDEAILGVFKGLGEAAPRLGVGGTLGVGAAFGRGRTLQALRFGVSADIFPARVDLLETSPAVDTPSRRAFWTPVVSFHLGRLSL